MFRKCICLLRKVIYTWNLARSSTCFDLSQEAYCRNDIPRAIVDLEKALKAGNKALNLLSGKCFPEATKARKGLRDALELMAKSREKLLFLSQRGRCKVDINHI